MEQNQKTKNLANNNKNANHNLQTQKNVKNNLTVKEKTKTYNDNSDNNIYHHNKNNDSNLKNTATKKTTFADFSQSQKRTTLSNTRTFLSYIRTSITCLSVVFAFIKLDKKHPIDSMTITLATLAILFFVLGIINYCKTKKQI